MLVNKMFLVLIIIVLLFEYFFPIKIYASISNVSPIKEETDNKTNENNSVAQALQTILNDNASTLGKYNTTLSQCEKIISRC